MVDFATMIKALRLKCIPRLLNPESSNWKTVPNYFFTKRRGLNFLLNCNYNVKLMEDMLRFYQDILSYLSELKALFASAQYEDTILFNNQEILIEGKPFCYKDWLRKGIYFIQHLLDKDGNFLQFESFRNKYSLASSNFLTIFQIVSSIPKHLLNKAKTTEMPPQRSYIASSST